MKNIITLSSKLAVNTARSRADIAPVWLWARRAIAAGERCAVWQRDGEPAWLAVGESACAPDARALAVDPAWPVAVPQIWFGRAFAAISEAASDPWRGWPQREAWIPAALFRVEEGPIAVAGSGLRAVVARMAHWPLPPLPLQAPQCRVPLSNEALAARIAAAEQACSDGTLTKVVVAGCEVWGEVAECDAPLLLARAPVGTTRFLYYAPGRGAFVGATPETLARVCGDRLETHALAGTIPAEAPLPPDDKLDREHEAVVTAIRAALMPLCEVVAGEPTPHRRRVGNLDHLETAIVGRLSAGRSLLDVVDVLHPTPAVGGVPRRAALDWLRAYEGLARGWYAGPLGWLRHDGGEVVVGLRSLLVRQGAAWAYAGAGIVAGSDATAEVGEIAAKLTPARLALAGLAAWR